MPTFAFCCKVAKFFLMCNDSTQKNKTEGNRRRHVCGRSGRCLPLREKLLALGDLCQFLLKIL